MDMHVHLACGIVKVVAEYHDLPANAPERVITGQNPPI
jgi:hypothetical protein